MCFLNENINSKSGIQRANRHILVSISQVTSSERGGGSAKALNRKFPRPPVSAVVISSLKNGTLFIGEREHFFEVGKGWRVFCSS